MPKPHATVHANEPAEHQETSDPVLQMLGVGKHLWEREPGDQFIDRLRSEDSPPAPFIEPGGARAENSPQQ